MKTDGVKIPKSFQLFGTTITVKIEDLGKKKYGDWDHPRQLIRIAPLGEGMTAEAQLVTFWHEAIHASLDTLSYGKLSKDEDFVDRLAHCIAQIIQTQRVK